MSLTGNEGVSMNELTEGEKDVVLNSLAYMVQAGLTSFEISLYRSSYDKLKREQDQSFDDVLKSCK